MQFAGRLCVVGPAGRIGIFEQLVESNDGRIDENEIYKNTKRTDKGRGGWTHRSHRKDHCLTKEIDQSLRESIIEGRPTDPLTCGDDIPTTQIGDLPILTDAKSQD